VYSRSQSPGPLLTPSLPAQALVIDTRPSELGVESAEPSTRASSFDGTDCCESPRQVCFVKRAVAVADAPLTGIPGPGQTNFAEITRNAGLIAAAFAPKLQAVKRLTSSDAAASRGLAGDATDARCTVNPLFSLAGFDDADLCGKELAVAAAFEVRASLGGAVTELSELRGASWLTSMRNVGSMGWRRLASTVPAVRRPDRIACCRPGVWARRPGSAAPRAVAPSLASTQAATTTAAAPTPSSS